MATACGITIIKKFTYRGNANEEYSNTYWLTGSPPANVTDWLALATAVANSERQVYPAGHVITKYYGYNDDTGHKPGDTGSVAPAAYSRDLVAAGTTIPGTMGVTGLPQLQGDSAMWVRWKTSRVTSPGGKAIYLRKYFHGCLGSAIASPDILHSSQVTALSAHAAKMWDGTLNAASQKITTCGPNDTILGANVSSYATTRTLKRRGKRPNA